MVVNQLWPYASFAEWSPLLDDVVARYVSAAHPKGVRKLGLRYVNKIEVPGEVFELEDYFTIYPKLPESLSDPHGPFIVRVESYPPAHPGRTLITSFGSSVSDDGSPTILLDVHVTREPDEGSMDSIAPFISGAHDDIVSAFESFITDRTQALLGGLSHAAAQ